MALMPAAVSRSPFVFEAQHDMLLKLGPSVLCYELLVSFLAELYITHGNAFRTLHATDNTYV
jgi:hypothetical protein